MLNRIFRESAKFFSTEIPGGNATCKVNVFQLSNNVLFFIQVLERRTKLCYYYQIEHCCQSCYTMCVRGNRLRPDVVDWNQEFWTLVYGLGTSFEHVGLPSVLLLAVRLCWAGRGGNTESLLLFFHFPFFMLKSKGWGGGGVGDSRDSPESKFPFPSYI